ncbi:hypothetical protein JQN58_07325 [Aneurinibacillus sp. BA2021]|nr:hypothetical protein [Aneurinibacillus sp. BA2021]
MTGVIRFFCIAGMITLIRFYVGRDSISFLWFFILYFPFINWSVYWLMLAVRIGVNKLLGKEKISVSGVRRFYKWYLNAPGGCVLAEVVYQGYIYNQ